MSPTVRFAPATADDADALVALRIAAMRESLERIGRFDPTRARERFLAGFAPECTRHILQGDVRIGFYVLKASDDGQQLLLDHLYIQPGHQGQGVGAAVLGHIFAEADVRGLPLRVGALRDSDSNRFYARYGFVLVEQAEFDNYYVRAAQPAEPVQPPQNH